MAQKQIWTEEKVHVGATEMVVIKGGKGKPLLYFHGELGFEGWCRWHSSLAEDRTLIIPLHPGFGRTPMADWIRNVRDLAGFYQRFVREQKLGPVDVIGHSLGGWIAAEMAACDPKQFRRAVLVAPMGIRPAEGEILDMFTVTARAYLTRSADDPSAAPEFATLFGGEGTPKQFEDWEDARAESARIGWEPYMFNPSLPHLLEAIGLSAMVVFGKQDPIVPPATGEVWQRAIFDAKLVMLDKCGHWPQVEQAAQFLSNVGGFIA